MVESLKKELRKVQKGFIVSPAAIGFERSTGAENGKDAKARFNRGSVFSLAKSSFPEFRLARQFNRVAFKPGFFTPIAAVLPALSASLSCRAAGKKTAICRSAPAPLQRIYSFGLITLNTRNATTAARNGYNGNSAMLGYSKERWGGGFVHPIANKQNKLVKVSITTVCVIEGLGYYVQNKGE